MKLKSKKKRTLHQRRWIERQLTDPYVKKAKKEGYRARAAYKLLDIDAKFTLLKRGQVILDLGAAPGSWSQVMSKKGCKVTAIDLLVIEPINHVTFLQGDFRQTAFECMYDGIVSDVSPSACGVPSVDHLKLIGMIEHMLPLVAAHLKPGGFFVCKVFQGGLESELLGKLKKIFKKTAHFKPPSSRKESAEEYLIAQGKK